MDLKEEKPKTLFKVFHCKATINRNIRNFLKAIELCLTAEWNLKMFAKEQEFLQIDWVSLIMYHIESSTF